MSTPTERLQSGYYNSYALSGSNLGGMGAGGHQTNFPAALADVGAVATQLANSAQSATAAAAAVAAGISGGILSLNAFVREKLLAPRTYYVRPNGNDANTGLVDSAGGAFVSIQRALDVVGGLDFNDQAVVIQLAFGLYVQNASLNKPWMGGGSLTLRGNPVAPGNVYISPATGVAFSNTAHLTGPVVLDGVSLAAPAGSCIANRAPGVIRFQNVVFGAAPAGHHLFADGLGSIVASGPYAIDGSALTHACIDGGGARLDVSNQTVTLTGTPAFANAFALATRGAEARIVGNVFSGPATGPRYSVTANAVIYANGATLPGSTSGAQSTGGQYV